MTDPVAPPVAPPSVALVAEPVGSGPAVIALHASGMSSRQFARFTKDAGGRYTVYAADLLGVGRTPLEGAYSLAREADALLSLARSLPEPPRVFAHSYGGLVAMEALLREPSAFRAMALFEPVVVVLAMRHGSDEAKEQRARIETLMREDVSGGDYSRWIEGFIDWWNGAGFYRSLPAAAQAQYLSTAAEAHRQATEVPRSTVTVEALAKVTVPALFLTGESSPTAARESAAIAARAMPNGSIERIPGAGHMAPLTHASAVNAAVLRFFDAR